MRRHQTALSLALATTLVGVFTSAVPYVSALENSLGLRALFQLRGSVAPPPDVVIVSIDETVGPRLGLERELTGWPRSVHGQLVDLLTEHGAAAIAFDVLFLSSGTSPAENRAFADAVARSGRVLLAERLEIVRIKGKEYAHRQSPILDLAKAAQGIAPPPLPVEERVGWFGAFLTTPDFSDEPTFPATLLQIHGLRALDAWVDLLERAGLPEAGTLPRAREMVANAPGLKQFMLTVRRGLLRDRSARAALRALAADVRTGDGEILRALAAMYTGDDARYLNFYGPVRTICTVPYDVILRDAEASRCPIRDAVVLVGAGHGTVERAGQPDTYHTAFDQNGTALSGVEILATAVANLLTRTSLRTPPPAAYLLLLAMFGGMTGIGYYVRTRRRLRPGALAARLQAAGVVFALAALYSACAFAAFQTLHLALPLVVPLAIQLPTALILGLMARPTVWQDQADAVVLATDAAGSTAIGQALPHGRYARLMSEYNEALLAPVTARGGAALEPQGDGFICLWCDPRGGVTRAMRQQACAAALEIVETSLRFDRGQPDGQQLPTRVGLNVGPVTIYSDADRGVFKAFGDTLNVAARIRDLNVDLGSHVLASSRTIDGLDDALPVRAIPGDTTLRGVTNPERLFVINTSNETI